MPADRSVEVKVEGLRELARGFKELEDDLPKALKGELLKVADAAAGMVQQRMPFVSGDAARSVKPRSSTAGASIAVGGRAAPYYPWLDFGGSTGRGHRPGVGGSGAIKREWLGANVISPAGRYLYPAIVEHREEIEEAALEAVERASRKADFEVRG